MDVTAVKLPDFGYGTAAPSGVDNAPKPDQPDTTAIVAKQDATSKDSKTKDSQTKGTNLTPENMDQISASLNQFLTLMGADVHFAVHEKTHRLMVKLVDDKTGKVLREYPPPEMLDMLAKISDYVGALLDKKA